MMMREGRVCVMCFAHIREFPVLMSSATDLGGNMINRVNKMREQEVCLRVSLTLMTKVFLRCKN